MGSILSDLVCICSSESSCLEWFSLEVGSCSLGEKKNFVVDHFQLIWLSVDGGGFPSVISSFFIICLGVEMIRENLQKMLTLLQRP